ncbi:hypothetical protein [Burkholderia stagnalis]|uniref:hypothetical protein n=1 Tax=Burkholderia stagnalis TaxID=1503054 RepID=UPI0012D8EE14|nr:hypothetical protein [Burkholderia stagnalis]
MTRLETIHQAIRHLYEATLAPDGWSRAGISVAEATAAHKTIFLGAQATSAPVEITTGFDVESARRMQREFEMQPPHWVDAIPIGTPQLTGARYHATLGLHAFFQRPRTAPVLLSRAILLPFLHPKAIV